MGNREKVENFQVLKIDPNVKIWTYIGEFWPKNQGFGKIFNFFFWLVPLRERALTVGENTYAFSARGTKKSKKVRKIRKKIENFQMFNIGPNVKSMNYGVEF